MRHSYNQENKKMTKNKRKDRVNIVYSTNPDFNYDYDIEQEQDTLPPRQQYLKVLLDKKQRKGKIVTLITGFTGKENDLNELAGLLKKKCGTGGAAKNGEILIQGDFKKKITEILQEMGYKVTG